MSSAATSCAASTAASHVPDSSADRCTDTTESTPSDRYAAANSPGVGREVDTCSRRSDSALDTSSGETSSPSLPVRVPSTTCSGTSETPYSSATPGGR